MARPLLQLWSPLPQEQSVFGSAKPLHPSGVSEPGQREGDDGPLASLWLGLWVLGPYQALDRLWQSGQASEPFYLGRLQKLGLESCSLNKPYTPRKSASSSVK